MDNQALITLIRPQMVIPKGHVSFSKGIPPIGLSYIAGALEKESFAYDVVDALGNEIEKIRHISINGEELLVRGSTNHQILEDISPSTKYIGISVMFTAEWLAHKILIKEIRAQFPDSIIILGGEHSSAKHYEILTNCREVDICVIGEGDETFTSLIKTLEQGLNLNNVDGIAFRHEENVVVTAKRKRISKIEELNTNWSKFPVEKYLDEMSGMNTLNLRAMPILATRGCPYQCTFCSSPEMWGTQYFYRSPESIVSEMEELIKRYKVEHFDFTDLSTTVNKKWTVDFCNLLIKKNLGVSWQMGAGTRSEVLNKDVLKLLKMSNIYKLAYAPESGSKTTLKKIKKRVNIDKMYLSIKHATEIGINVKAQFIMGMPGQTLREMFESLFFILKLAYVGVDSISSYIFYPYPGSELSKQLELNGHLASEDDYIGMTNTVISFNNHSQKQNITYSPHVLTFFTSFTMLLFYIVLYVRRPQKIFKSMRNIWNNKPKSSMEMFLYMKFAKPSS